MKVVRFWRRLQWRSATICIPKDGYVYNVSRSEVSGHVLREGKVHLKRDQMSGDCMQDVGTRVLSEREPRGAASGCNLEEKFAP